MKNDNTQISDREKDILKNFSVIIPKLSDADKFYLLGLGEGLAMKKEKKKVAAELQLHSDQGFQYTSPGYFNPTQSYGITPSMSKKRKSI